jgi:pyridoxal phosphate enzyme (YggS family)
VQERLDAVRRRLAAACDRSGRAPSDVTLVAVTKYIDLDALARLVAAGVTDVGENQAQQLRDRAPSFPGVRWHAIGPLQRNKVKYVARHADAFHALADAGIARSLSERRIAEGREALPCYVQVNVAGEETKAGVAPADLAGLLGDLRAAELPGIDVIGLMAMPPLASRPEDARPWFARLAALAADHGLTGLSMGTTADFEVAVEEGATAVRIGSALL